jgi:hypothetical protein
MANIIKIKSSETINKIPQAADLQVAELAINLADQKIYSKKSNGSVIPLGANGVQVYIQETAPTIAKDGDFWVKRKKI